MLFLQHYRIGFVFCCCALASGQTFEAASVKPFDGSVVARMTPEERRSVATPSGGPGSKDPGRIHYLGVSLQYLVLKAFDLNDFELQGPDWLNAGHCTVDATLPPGSTPAQFHAMLRNLLIERFKLATHSESKQLSGYALQQVGGKLKLRESSGAPAPPDDGAAPPLTLGADHYFVPPDRQGVFLQLTGPQSARSNFRQVTMAELVKTVQNQMKRPILDETGLSGKYDFVLSYSTEGLYLGSGRLPIGPAGEESAPDMIHALKDQLGLKLEPRKIATQVIVIDHMEKIPTGN